MRHMFAGKWLVMAYTVMAHIVMDHIVVAYIAMVYLVMAHVVVAYVVMAHSGDWVAGPPKGMRIDVLIDMCAYMPSGLR